MTAPAALHQLVEQFEHERQVPAGDAGNSENRRQWHIRFIVPLFRLLGWDIDPTPDRTSTDFQVLTQWPTPVEPQAEHPFFLFRAANHLKYLLDIRDPADHFTTNSKASFRLRRFAWSAKVELAICTNFEELAIYDCRMKPGARDKPTKGRIHCFGYLDYAKHWDTIASLLGRDSVVTPEWTPLPDSKLIPKSNKARPRQTNVDDELIKDLTKSRLAHATCIRQQHPELSLDDLKQVVDSSLDEMLFQQFAQARGYRILESPTGGSITGPESPYDFSIIPVEILGRVYEQCLGQSLQLSDETGVTLQSTTKVKRAGGVYYTPTYVVRWMVEQTIGRLLKGKSIEFARNVKVLDPACGCGCFLIGAYQYLLDWHRDWLLSHVPSDWPDSIEWIHGEWRLTRSKRQEILLNNLYGVDLDRQAVQIARRSLLLKLMDGDSRDPQQHQCTEIAEELPNLKDTIQCGNSLIEPDDCVVGGGESDKWNADTNTLAFDWQRQFPKVFLEGGFDVVIGNPPYRREKDFKHLLDEIAQTRLGKRYRTPRMDLWYYFVHRGLEVLRPGGVLSFITNAYWTAGQGSEKLIAALRDEATLSDIAFLGKLNIFPGVTGQHLIFQVVNQKLNTATQVKTVPAEALAPPEDYFTGRATFIQFEKQPNELYRTRGIDLQPPATQLLKKLEQHACLESLGIVRQGIAENPAAINQRTLDRYRGTWQVGEGVFALRAAELAALNLSLDEHELIRPYHDLKDLGRYSISETPSLNLIYSTPRTCSAPDQFPRIKAHLDRFRIVMQERRETKAGQIAWWQLHWPRDEVIWKSPKIISIQMGPRPEFAYATGPLYVPFSVNVFRPEPGLAEGLEYVCGILNSRLMWKWFQHHAKRRGVGLEINGHILKRAPIRRIDLSQPFDRDLYSKIVQHVTAIVELKQRAAKQSDAQERSRLTAQTRALDDQIDHLVYQLYDLTPSEIAQVEASTELGATANTK